MKNNLLTLALFALALSAALPKSKLLRRMDHNIFSRMNSSTKWRADGN
jgi:hypothetical protein